MWEAEESCKGRGETAEVVCSGVVISESRQFVVIREPSVFQGVCIARKERTQEGRDLSLRQTRGEQGLSQHFLLSYSNWGILD